jgi:hypothetical protein
MDGRDKPRVRKGSALSGHGAEAVRDAIAKAITALPPTSWAVADCDQGAERAQHVRLRIDTGLQVYFCDPQSPWQRATNENTNGLLRQYVPKGTDLARHTVDDLATVAAAPNTCPRKTLGWRTLAEILSEHLARRRDPAPSRGTTGGRARLSPLRPALRANVRDDRRVNPAIPPVILARPLACDEVR